VLSPWQSGLSGLLLNSCATTHPRLTRRLCYRAQLKQGEGNERLNNIESAVRAALEKAEKEAGTNMARETTSNANKVLFCDLIDELGISGSATDDQCRLMLETIAKREQIGLITAEQAREFRLMMGSGVERAFGVERGLGVERDDKRTEAKQASQTVSLTEAKLAKKLGYELCLCTFPPSVMLWRETEKANVCPSCGRQS
jgi:hypothetical protein